MEDEKRIIFIFRCKHHGNFSIRFFESLLLFLYWKQSEKKKSPLLVLTSPLVEGERERENLLKILSRRINVQLNLDHHHQHQDYQSP